jgi:hypothetical protein
MTDPGLYFMKLSFTPPPGVVGAGSMSLAVTVLAPTGALHGQATGTILQGTANPASFTAQVSGAMHSTGFGKIVRVGSVSGRAEVYLPPPEIGTYHAAFSASFALDSTGSGQGQFSVGKDTYKCDVKVVE